MKEAYLMAKNSQGKIMSEAEFSQYMADSIAREAQRAAYPEHRRVPNPVIARAQAAANRQLSPEAQAHFARPALRCELCGGPMTFENKEWEAWERKWSVHKTCADAVWNQLDRRTGITAERQR
jgi:hypothetical protein